MNLFKRFLRYMNPSVDPKALEDMDRQSLRSIHYISLIVLVIEIGLEIVFFSAHLEHMDHQAVLSLVSVSYCIAFCAAGSLISRRMMQLETIRHSRFFLFKIIFFILFIVWAIFADYRHYKAGDQMLTFWVVNLVMICFILFRPWIGVLLVGGAFAGLYIPPYLYNGAQDRPGPGLHGIERDPVPCPDQRVLEGGPAFGEERGPEGQEPPGRPDRPAEPAGPGGRRREDGRPENDGLYDRHQLFQGNQ